jgi:hypothetical protein
LRSLDAKAASIFERLRRDWSFALSKTIRERDRAAVSLSQMGRNLYILAASLTVFALLSCGVAYSNIAQQPGSPGDVALWRTMGLVLFVIALIVALAGVLSTLFEQAERRAEAARRRRPRS